MDALRVLVVDDEPGMRTGIKRVLDGYRVPLPEADSEVGFTVNQAESGEEAMVKIGAAPPDILLLDHKLAGAMSGLDVLAQLAERSGDVLTIMITAYATLETAVAATKRGAFDFLAKPFTPQELRATIAKSARHVTLQRKARQHAEEKRRIRFEFLSVLAHELKAPLAATEGYLHLLRDHTLGDQLATYDEVVVRGTERLAGMRRLIMDLLDLTRIESGQKQRDLVELDLREAARNAIEMVAADAAARHLTVTLHGDGPVRLQADRGEVEIICNNLLTNAVKYNREGGQVDVRLVDQPQRVLLRVSDTGIGMSREETAGLFREFGRIRNDKTRMIPGTGLGLSMVRKLALLYGGDVRVESQPDVGSTFEVSLPRGG